ncbi:nucleolar and spindle-associated protein 1 isoform X2 [Hyla sarda]|uniref:nucleolar and spindle-associated protein 1 isoform X2 n=1 Tax=Hyla sarda TaxID=327740 RepID=UPI0024C4390D|nr:nucleolar and spindle-associated protein 1 isoform X2 [Hyla sarda]
MGNKQADRLLRILKKHFHPAFGAENSSSDSDGNSTLPDDIQGTLDEEQVSICHVTLRRGRAKKENHADSSPEVENKVKTIQGDGAEKDAAETSISTSLQQDQPDEPQENIVVTAKVAKKRRSKGKSSSGRKLSSKIPKSSGKSKAGSKPSTPNFKRLHEAHFKKMESIDKYLERKQKRLDAITTSIQEVKMLTEGSEQLSLKKTPGSNSKKSLPNRFSLLSPKPQTSYLSAKTPANQRSAGKRSILVDKSGVKPSTFSSSKMNVRFSGATKDNEHKYSLVKTPARKSSTFLPNADNSEARKSLPLAKKKPAQGTEETNTPAAVTPFKFTAENVTTPNTNKKMKFDLQASLSRPLGYQPYKGKLKPWGETKENKDAAQNRSSMLKNNYKQPPASTRDERRKQHEKDRKNQRDKTLGSRRGVAVL